MFSRFFFYDYETREYKEIQLYINEWKGHFSIKNFKKKLNIQYKKNARKIEKLVNKPQKSKKNTTKTENYLVY